jgi:hypothetical protein
VEVITPPFAVLSRHRKVFLRQEPLVDKHANKPKKAVAVKVKALGAALSGLLCPLNALNMPLGFELNCSK